MIRNFSGIAPKVAPSAYIDPQRRSSATSPSASAPASGPARPCAATPHPSASAIGDQHSGQLRAPCWTIGFPLTIGNRVTVGHSVMLHGCTIEDDTLIGIGSIILNGAKIGKGSVVAAGALVPEGMEVPPSTLVMGVPAKLQRAVTAEEQARFAEGVQHYVEKAAVYREANRSIND